MSKKIIVLVVGMLVSFEVMCKIMLKLDATLAQTRRGKYWRSSYLLIGLEVTFVLAKTLIDYMRSQRKL